MTHRAVFCCIELPLGPAQAYAFSLRHSEWLHFQTRPPPPCLPGTPCPHVEVRGQQPGWAKVKRDAVHGGDGDGAETALDPFQPEMGAGVSAQQVRGGMGWALKAEEGQSSPLGTCARTFTKYHKHFEKNYHQ